MGKEKAVLDKKGWANNFALVGEVKISDNSFKMDCHSEKSGWLYNQMYLNVYCGDAYGNVSCELMGGYGLNRQNVIYCHGINEDGSDNFSDRITVDWDDRLSEDVIKSVGRSCYMNASLEKMDNGKYYRKPFLHAYDYIRYIHDHLKDGDKVVVSGKLKYNEYNGVVRVQKEVNSIRRFNEDEMRKLNSGEQVYQASFRQTILVNNDTVIDVDEKRGVVQLTPVVLEYFKKFNGYDVSGNVPLRKSMEMHFNNMDDWKKWRTVFFSQKRGYDEIKFSGYFSETGSTVTLTEDDLSDDVKALISIGAFTLEEALKDVAGNGQRVSKMVLTKPVLACDENNKVIMDITRRKYDEEDLQLECLVKKQEEEDDESGWNDAEKLRHTFPGIAEMEDSDLDDIFNNLE